MTAPRCYKKVADLLDRFSEDPLPPLLKKVDVAHARGDSLTIKTHTKSVTYYLINKYDRHAYGTSIKGCLAGEFNVYVYSAIECLALFGDITDDEAADFSSWLHNEDKREVREAEFKKLEQSAKTLGYRLEKI